MLCAALVLVAPGVLAQSEEKTRVLQALGAERELLTVELEQYQKTLDLLQSDGTPPEQSSNPAVRKLAEEVVHLKERMIAIARQEVTLLQQQIIEARSRQRAAVSPAREDALLAEANSVQGAVAVAPNAGNRTPSAADLQANDMPIAMEGKPLRLSSVDYTLAQEAEKVERLHELLESYHAQVQEASATLPTLEELERREAARRDAETLARIPFSADKVRLSGSEGSTALAMISERLSDPLIPESRRDIALICVIKTRLFGKLVGSENRSLKPVGKNHYVARVRLQPGDTTLGIQGHQWTLRLPENGNGQDFLLTLYRPPQASPVLHVFAVDDLLAQERAHIPAWLPDDLKLRSRRG
ncbi:MAG: hypothetical protein KDI09_17850 [Halioglobus sp.]|nr:hypothetical protein [Halioglobus sp.]